LKAATHTIRWRRGSSSRKRSSFLNIEDLIRLRVVPPEIGML
jgi:hypothetical protein